MFHNVHGKNIILSSDSSQANRINGFCNGITFTNSPLTQLQRITFQVAFDSDLNAFKSDQKTHLADNTFNNRQINLKKSKKPMYNGSLRIGLTSKNPITFTELPLFSYPTLLDQKGFWITTVKSSYLKQGNKISLILDKDNSLQLSVNYVLKANLFANKMIQISPSSKLWLIIDLYGNTNSVKFLPSDYTPYEIKARGLDAVNNFHSACLSGGSKSMHKTRLIILGQKGVGKTTLRNSLISFKNPKKSNNNRFSRNIETSTSIRVKIDKTSNWHLKNIIRSEFSDDLNFISKLRRQNSASDLTGLSVKNISENKTENNNSSSRLNKRRSSSTSYLNEKDDYDDDDPNQDYYNGEYLKKFRRQLSLDETEKTKTNNLDNLVTNETNQKIQSNDINESNDYSSDDSKSDESDKESNADLYAIDECDELIQTYDQSNEFKKDPTGYYYRKIAMNIYQELYSTKLYDKLCSSTNDSSPGSLNSFTESYFEKLAVLEFETSVYNQIECSSILKFYYEKIVLNEMKLIQSKSTILVNPFIKKQNSIETDQQTSSKKLSLTILDFAGSSFFYTTHQIFLSSRAVYLYCFDLTKDLNDFSQSNFELGFKQNNELTNLDYLDLWMKSIHYHAAKMPEITETNVDQNQSNEQYTSIKIDENYEINFKKSILSPPILIVGTNRHKLMGDHIMKNDIIKSKFEKIKDFISNKIYAKHIIEPFFAVDMPPDSLTDTIDSHQNRKETNSNDIEGLKKVIEIIAANESYMGEQQPVKWMKFENSLEKLKSKGLFYASLSQICEIAHEKEINTQEELTTCLNFFHDLGTIIYYGNANDIFLRNTIILRPQKLVDIFKLVLDAKIPNLKKNEPSQSTLRESSNHSLFDSMFKDTGSSITFKHGIEIELWKKFDKRGILDERLIDFLWNDYIDQKPGLLGLMKKFDLICERSLMNPKNEYCKESLNKEYLVPSRAKIRYHEDFIDNTNRATDKYQNQDYSYDDIEENDIEDLTDHSKYNQMRYRNESLYNSSVVEFYYDFGGFLPESLFSRILTRAARWTLLKNGANLETSVRLYWRKARFYLDSNHEFVIEMASLKYARIKIQVIRLNTNINGCIGDQTPPEPNACAKVRNFMESVLIDLRNLWMKRLNFNACVQCFCDKTCQLHQFEMCSHNQCIHFLNLDECLTNNIVYCEYRRVKTLIYKNWFPTQNISLHKGPVLAAIKSYLDKNMFYDETSLPVWIKNVARLLQAKDRENKESQIVTIQNENDWLALARLLGYNKSKINYFMEAETPALQMICDWIMSSDNTNLTIEFLLNYLEQLKRDDAIKIINNERENETINSSVFISYHWDNQEDVLKIKDCLEKSGFKCFMDIGQIGGGNLLYQKIDQAIRNAKVVIACITPKFVVSHFCNREMALADLLRKPIVPIMMHMCPWPPPGGMSLIFSQLVYVDYFGVGGHGGVGMHADREQRNNEIVAMVSRHVNPSSYFLMNIDRMSDNDQNQVSKTNKKMAGRGSSQFYQNHHANMFITEINSTNRNYFQANNRFRSSTANENSINRPVYRGNDLANQNNSNNNLRNNNSDPNNQTQLPSRPKCTICNIV